jgi:hypothetical protein
MIALPPSFSFGKKLPTRCIMDIKPITHMKKFLILTIALLSLGAISAQAHVSVGVGVGFYGAPAYYSPAPVYYTPAYYPAPVPAAYYATPASPEIVYYSGIPYSVVYYGGCRHYVRYHGRW